MNDGGERQPSRSLSCECTSIRRPFAPLSIPNYRRFFVGQVFARCGSWVQAVAEIWLVLQLTGSGVSLGLTTALQFAPMLLLGPWAGVWADRMPKRRILLAAQGWMIAPALTLLVLTGTDAVELWMVYALVLARGLGHAVDTPVRQAFVMEVVGREHVAAAVSLNSAVVSTARLVGPAVAGGLIAGVGIAPCFAVSCAAFLVAVGALLAVDPVALQRQALSGRVPGQLREGLSQVRSNPALRLPLTAMAVVGTLAFNFQVVLPLMARYAFHGGAGTYGALAAAMGAGAIVGAVTTAGRRSHSLTGLGAIGLAFGALLAALAAAPTLGLALAALVLMGAASISFTATTNSLLQLAAPNAMRGRVMALWSVVYLGSTTVGGPIVGWVSEQAGPRAGLALGALATVATGAGLLMAQTRSGRFAVR
ncbi:MAG TPA: MFS transporter [Thermoleophilaceae bacterium]|nr:MFS transporter [Thermoleophilaceae bacterium]